MRRRHTPASRALTVLDNARRYERCPPRVDTLDVHRSRLVSNRSKVRYQLGLVNFAAAPPLEHRVDEVVSTTNAVWLSSAGSLMPATFRDPPAGWVVRGLAAPFVRVLGVSDPTPEEVAAAAAAAAAANV